METTPHLEAPRSPPRKESAQTQKLLRIASLYFSFRTRVAQLEVDMLMSMSQAAVDQMRMEGRPSEDTDQFLDNLIPVLKRRLRTVLKTMH
jgi:hypothetical protein